MRDKHTDKIHAELARQIRLAKKRMFKRHREGDPLASVGRVFLSEITSVLDDLDRADLNRDADAAEMLGHAPEQPTRYTHENPVRLREDLASAVSEILSNDMAPPRLRDAVRDYVADAPTEEEAPQPPPARDNPRDYPSALTDAELIAACKEVANYLEDRDAIGCLLALLDHVHLLAGVPMDASGAILDIQKYMLMECATGRDAAADMLADNARKYIRESK